MESTELENLPMPPISLDGYATVASKLWTVQTVLVYNFLIKYENLFMFFISAWPTFINFSFHYSPFFIGYPSFASCLRSIGEN